MNEIDFGAVLHMLNDIWSNIVYFFKDAATPEEAHTKGGIFVVSFIIGLILLGFSLFGKFELADRMKDSRGKIFTIGIVFTIIIMTVSLIEISRFDDMETILISGYQMNQFDELRKLSVLGPDESVKFIKLNGKSLSTEKLIKLLNPNLSDKEVELRAYVIDHLDTRPVKNDPVSGSGIEVN